MLRSLLPPPAAAAPPPAVPTLQVTAGSALVTVRLRYNPRARRFTLRVTATGEVVLTLPPGGTHAAAQRFAERHSGWIAGRLAQHPAVVPFADGAIIPLRGVGHRIVHVGGRGIVKRRAAAVRGDTPTLVVPGEEAHLPRRVRDFLKAQAQRDVTAAVDRHAATLGVTISRVQIKDTRSRWGSCSPAGALALSWRLVMAPPFVLDYLAAHEVAHRREMNHGPRFWRLVRTLAPHTDEAEAWLKANGRALHLIGPAPAAATPPLVPRLAAARTSQPVPQARSRTT
jgi:predicted metal-dependent hydrolase